MRRRSLVGLHSLGSSYGVGPPVLALARRREPGGWHGADSDCCLVGCSHRVPGRGRMTAMLCPIDKATMLPRAAAVVEVDAAMTARVDELLAERWQQARWNRRRWPPTANSCGGCTWT